MKYHLRWCKKSNRSPINTQNNDTYSNDTQPNVTQYNDIQQYAT